jgi:endonuclease-3
MRIDKVIEIMAQTLKDNKFSRATALENLQVQEEGDPFKILIGTILSSRTRDENTSKAVEKLFSKYKRAEDIAYANIEDLKENISQVGFYNIKADRIKKVASIIMNKFNGNVPNSLEDLLSLPGVGRKTANCVLVYGFNKPAIPVDTHVHRIFNRLGIIKTESPKKTEKELSKLLDEKHWIKLNSTVVRYGQNVCLPIHPKCTFCNLKESCNYYKNLDDKLK